jgi:hypothetical protein
VHRFTRVALSTNGKAFYELDAGFLSSAVHAAGNKAFRPNIMILHRNIMNSDHLTLPGLPEQG